MSYVSPHRPMQASNGARLNYTIVRRSVLTLPGDPRVMVFELLTPFEGYPPGTWLLKACTGDRDKGDFRVHATRWSGAKSDLTSAIAAAEVMLKEVLA